MRWVLALLVACPLVAGAASYDDALRLRLEKAAAHGDVQAQTNLGMMYENGLWVAQDDVKSAYWFRLAAEGGDRSAQFRFGEICYMGTGIASDKAEAVKWWTLATTPEDDVSVRMRSMIQSAMIKIPADVAEDGLKRAREWRRIKHD